MGKTPRQIQTQLDTDKRIVDQMYEILANHELRIHISNFPFRVIEMNDVFDNKFILHITAIYDHPYKNKRDMIIGELQDASHIPFILTVGSFWTVGHIWACEKTIRIGKYKTKQMVNMYDLSVCQVGFLVNYDIFNKFFLA